MISNEGDLFTISQSVSSKLLRNIRFYLHLQVSHSHEPGPGLSTFTRFESSCPGAPWQLKAKYLSNLPLRIFE